MDNNYILTLKNITKEFPGVKALDDVTINIERGTIHGLVGENGAGKSTLIKVLAGIYQPNKGEIILDGKPCRFNSPIEARRAGISVVHQEIKLAEPLSVAENMFLGNVQLKTVWLTGRACAAARGRSLKISAWTSTSTRRSRL